METEIAIKNLISLIKVELSERGSMSFYQSWVKLWKLENPEKIPLTEEQFNQLIEMFQFTPKELGLPTLKESK